MKLDGKRVLVTGASSGIGAEIARAAAERGARLQLVARGREGLERLAGEIRGGGGDAEVHSADLGDMASVDALARALTEADTVPDVLVNNAGAGRWLAIDETEPGEGLKMTAVPYLAAFELTRGLSPAMIERGSGQILNMTSAAAFAALPGANGYGTARWAMRAFNRHLAEDLRGTGVSTLLMAPAEVDSPYFDNNPGARERIPGVSKMLGGAMTTGQVAEQAVKAIERGKQGELIVPLRARLVIRTTPAPLMRALVRRTGWKRPG